MMKAGIGAPEVSFASLDAKERKRRRCLTWHKQVGSRRRLNAEPDPVGAAQMQGGRGHCPLSTQDMILALDTLCGSFLNRCGCVWAGGCSFLCGYFQVKENLA